LGGCAGGPGKTSPEDENRDEEKSCLSFRSADTSTAVATNNAETNDNFMLNVSRIGLEVKIDFSLSG
jgi:hypothetical protein